MSLACCMHVRETTRYGHWTTAGVETTFIFRNCRCFDAITELICYLLSRWQPCRDVYRLCRTHCWLSSWNVTRIKASQSQTSMSQARFPFKRNRLRCVRCVRCVNENRNKRKRLRWQAANHGCHCFDRAFLLAGATPHFITCTAITSLTLSVWQRYMIRHSYIFNVLSKNDA